MSALSFTRRKKVGMTGTVACVASVNCGSNARWKAEILGWPAGVVCDSHKKVWKDSWERSIEEPGA